MLFVGAPRSRLVKPYPRLNLNNSLLDAVIEVATPDFEFVSKLTPTTTSGSLWHGTPLGRGFEYTQAGSNFHNLSRLVSPLTPAGTILAICYVRNLTNAIGLFSTSNSSNYHAFNLQINTTGSIELLLGSGTGVGASDRRSFATTATFAAGAPLVIAASATSMTAAQVAVNGAIYATSNSGGAAIYSTGTDPGVIGRRPTGPMYGNKNILLVASWNRALSSAELVSLTSRPWQLFEPRRILVPVAAAAGGITGPLIHSRHLMTNGPLVSGRLVQ